MAGISGVISAYRQPDQINRGSERTYESTSSKVASSNSSKESQTSKVETKGFTPIDTKSSLVPKTTEYGNTEAKNSLTSSGASVKNFGMSVDSNGKESFFATVEKSQDLQKKRIEKKAAEKKEQKAKEKKKAEKEAREERLQKAKDKKAEKTDSDKEDAEAIDNEEYITFEANSVDELIFKVQNYSYNSAAGRVMTESERMVGSKFDIKG